MKHLASRYYFNIISFKSNKETKRKMIKALKINRDSFLGFTLIELLVVISVIGVLSSVLLVSLNGSREKAKNARAIAEMKQINTAINVYLSNHDMYPCFDSSASYAWEIADTDLQKYIRWPTPPWPNTIYGLHRDGGYAIAIYFIPVVNAQAIDTAIDDGNLSTGKVVSSVNIQGYKLLYYVDSAPEKPGCT